MRKLFALLLITMLALGVVPSPAQSAEQVRLVMWVPSQTDAENTYYEEAITRFNQQNPDIVVDVQRQVYGNDYDTKLSTSRLSGDFPDVFVAYLYMIATRGARGEYYPLDEFAQSWDDRNDMFESVLNSGHYEGQLVALGFKPTPQLLVYRKDFFAEAGYAEGEVPANWDDLKAFAEKLTVRDDKGNVTRAGFDMPTLDSGYNFTNLICMQNGAFYANEQTGTPQVNTPEMVEAYEFMRELYNMNISIPFDHNKLDSYPFLAGNSAMSYIVSSTVMAYLKNNPDMADKIGFIPPLAQKQPATFSALHFLAINSGCEHPREAWRVLAFLMSDEEMYLRYQSAGVPVVKSSLQEKFIADDPVLNRAMFDAIEVGYGKPRLTWTSIAEKILAPAWESVMNNHAGAQEALDEAQAAIEMEIQNMQ